MRGSSTEPLIGLYEEGTHNVVDIPQCQGPHFVHILLLICYCFSFGYLHKILFYFSTHFKNVIEHEMSLKQIVHFSSTKRVGTNQVKLSLPFLSLSTFFSLVVCVCYCSFFLFIFREMIAAHSL